MNATTQDELLEKRCVPCEGGVPPLSREEAEALVRRASRAGRSTPTRSRSRRSWTMKNFMAGIDFFNKVAALAEDEGHHPDLHLEGYRQRHDRPVDPRRRRPHRKRLHPRRQDQPAAGSAPPLSVRGLEARSQGQTARPQSLARNVIHLRLPRTLPRAGM